jgi:transglutaminase-like putative cysteine protease
MRFGLVHRIMTDALATLGVLAVVSTASLSVWTNCLLLGGLALALVIPDSWQGRPALRHFATLAPLALLVVQGSRLVAGRSPLDVAVEFAALLQIVRLATRRGAAHDQQIIVLALLHFIAGTVLGGGLTYGLCFIGFLVVAPGALVLSHLRREVEGNYRQGARDRTGLPVDVPRILRSRRVVGKGFLGATCLLAVPILVFTTVLFLVFPRIGLSLLLLSHPHAGRMIGFSEHVDLGDVGTLRDDPTIALRFETTDIPNPPPARMTIRLRGTALDRYDGHAWARSQRDVPHPSTRPNDVGETYQVFRAPDPKRDRVLSIDLEPIDPPVVFLPPRTAALRVRMPSSVLLGEPLTIQRGADDEFRYAGSDTRGLRYEAYLAPADETPPDLLPDGDRDRYLQLPSDLSSRIPTLAHEWSDRYPTIRTKAFALERHLRQDFIYDLHSPSGGKAQPLEDFLFVSHRGHCEFFSTAMAVMLRTLGIPSRNVTGFVGGTWNRFGRYYAVREGDAHSWVEAYLEEPGHPATWQTFDPTPTNAAQPMEPPTGAYYYLRDFVEALSQRWNTYVVGYDLHKQVRLFDDVSHRYSRFRRSIGLRNGPLDVITRGPTVAFGILVLSVIGYALWRRRHMSIQAPPKDRNRLRDVDPGTVAIVTLFRRLESALHALGVTRPRSVPPLRHAEDLATHGHPLGPEVLSLTQVYLEARFGGRRLSEAIRNDFARRVRDIGANRANREQPRQP